MAELGEVIEPVRIDHKRVRQSLVGLMMVDDDDVETEPARLGKRFVAGGAAIDGDEQLGAALGEASDRFDVRSIAFENPIRNMDDRIEAASAQEAREQRGSRRAIDIIIAEDRDAFGTHDRVGKPRSRFRHGGDDVRVGHQPPHGRIEKALDLVGLNAAPGEDARKQFGNIVGLRNRESARGTALVEPVAPGAAARRTLDVEKEPRSRFWHCCQGKVMMLW